MKINDLILTTSKNILNLINKHEKYFLINITNKIFKF